MNPNFLSQLAALWKQERATVAARSVAARRDTPLADRVARGDALKGVEVEDYEAAPGDRIRLWIRRPPSNDELRLRPGSPLRLWWNDPDGPEAVRAIADRQRGGGLAVLVEGEPPDRILHGAFNVDLDDPQAVFAVGDRAIRRFQDAKPNDPVGRLGAVLYGEGAPTFGRGEGSQRDPDLNASQQAAVVHALGAEAIALIHGPPGTGKTRTLVEVIGRAVARGERILATAMSNTAVDHLAAGLIAAGLPVLRLGHPTRIAPAVEKRSLDALLDASETRRLVNGWMSEARRLRDRAFTRRDRGSGDRAGFRDALFEARQLERDARDHLRRAQSALIEGIPIICTTVSGADTLLRRDALFDRLVLDEATQVPDPLALAAFARAPKAVLAGDPQQLPPTIIDQEAERAGLGRTFFERLAKRCPEAVSLLAVQYRMHADLMAFPSESRYGGQLIAAPEVAGRTLADLGVAPDESRPTPLVLIDTAGKGWEEDVDGEGSAGNVGQAERTAAEVRRLLSRGLPATDLAVITPYNAQRRRLRELLLAEVGAGLEIGTVDGFQGREKEAIIVDLVRSNEDGEVGFVADRRRLNVALTRAKRLLLVIADTATLGNDPDFKGFLDAVEARGTWLSAWADEAEPL